MDEKKENVTVEEPENTAGEQETKQAEKKDNLPKTQDELDAIIRDRIRRERQKMKKATEASQEQPEAQNTVADDGELQRVQRELLEERAINKAITLNKCNPEYAGDAVVLALREVEKNGEEPNDDNVQEALQVVIKRNSAWQTSDENRGGIKVGAEPDDKKETTAKGLPQGQVIF